MRFVFLITRTFFRVTFLILASPLVSVTHTNTRAHGQGERITLRDAAHGHMHCTCCKQQKLAHDCARETGAMKKNNRSSKKDKKTRRLASKPVSIEQWVFFMAGKLAERIETVAREQKLPLEFFRERVVELLLKNARDIKKNSKLLALVDQEIDKHRSEKASASDAADVLKYAQIIEQLKALRIEIQRMKEDPILV